MLSCSEELGFNKRERDRIKSEINDLEAKIVVEGGRRNRVAVNDYRRRINILKGRLNEANQRIYDLEKNHGQIQVAMPVADIVPANGIMTITDDIEMDMGFIEKGVEIIETVSRTIERTVKYKNGEMVSQTQTFTENRTRRISKKDDLECIDVIAVK